MKKLEDLLNLPESKELIKEEKVKEKKSDPDALRAQDKAFREIAEFDKIAAALPAVDGLGQMADIELNEVSDKAMQAYEDLMDLGMDKDTINDGNFTEGEGYVVSDRNSLLERLKGINKDK